MASSAPWSAKLAIASAAIYWIAYLFLPWLIVSNSPQVGSVIEVLLTIMCMVPLYMLTAIAEFLCIYEVERKGWSFWLVIGAIGSALPTFHVLLLILRLLAKT